MQYESDREDPAYESWGEPSLAEMTATAIKILSRNKEGYFLLVEGQLRTANTVSLPSLLASPHC